MTGVLVCVCLVHQCLRVWVYMTRQSRWCAANPLQLVSSTEEDPSMNPLMRVYMQNTLMCKLVKVSHFAHRGYKSDDVTSSQCHLFSTTCFSYSWASKRQQHQSHKWEFPYTRFKMIFCQQQVDWESLPAMSIYFLHIWRKQWRSVWHAQQKFL